ncbi:MAG: hypothetical protein IJO98_06285 [Clostridia bacterium]|nr:hypothetical protein [Clostridia bacterium]
MKTDELLHAIGDIREDWIADAHTNVRKKYRFPVIAAAVMLIMTLTVSALATADMDGMYELLYAVAPSIAQKLRPVQMSCVDNGIELTVISADVEGDTARVFLGLRDLEGERVDETCDLYDSYGISLPSDLIGTCSFSDFDEETRTAVFLVDISRSDGKKIKGDKLTFTLREFLSGSKEYFGFPDLDLSQTEMNPATRTLEDWEVRGGGGDASFDLNEITEVLSERKELFKPIGNVTVTGIGYVDGLLHIQIHFADRMENDGHGYISLENEKGREIFDLCHISFWDETGKGSYDELVFDISPEELKNCKPFGYFKSAEDIHRGDWEITFPLG